MHAVTTLEVLFSSCSLNSSFMSVFLNSPSRSVSFGYFRPGFCFIEIIQLRFLIHIIPSSRFPVGKYKVNTQMLLFPIQNPFYQISGQQIGILDIQIVGQLFFLKEIGFKITLQILGFSGTGCRQCVPPHQPQARCP